MWSRPLFTLVKKMSGPLSMRGVRPIAVLPDRFHLYSKNIAVTGGPSSEITSWSNKPLNGTIPIFFTDCDAAATFDHVSHHMIVNATEAMKVLQC